MYLYVCLFVCVYIFISCTRIYPKILTTDSGHRTRSSRHREAETADATLAMAAMVAMVVMAAMVAMVG